MKQLIGFLFVVGLVLAYWQWIVALIVVVLIIRAAPVAWREWQAEQAARQAWREELAARGDQQHAWVCQGDERGTYGEGYVGLSS